MFVLAASSADALAWMVGAVTVVLWACTSVFAFWRRRWMLVVSFSLFACLSSLSTLVYTGVLVPSAGVSLLTRCLSLLGASLTVSSFVWQQRHGRGHRWTP